MKRFPLMLALAMGLSVSTSLSMSGPVSGVPAASSTEKAPGAHLRAAYMVGLDIHTASGRVVHVPLPARLGRATDTHLLGRSPRGWVVAAGNSFFVVKGDQATRIATRNRGDLYVTEMLSDDGRHIVSATSDQADQVGVHVYDLEGTLVGLGVRENLGGDVKDATGDQVYVAGFDGVDVVTIGGTEEPVRVLNRGADLVSLEHDTVFVRISKKSYYRYGPTSLSDPGRPQWQAKFNAEDISPGGTYVLGADGQVRKMADGRVVSNLPVRQDDGTFSIQVGWAGERTIVHVVSRGDLQGLGRCDVVTGRCSRVVPLTKRNVSLPTSVAGPYVMP